MELRQLKALEQEIEEIPAVGYIPGGTISILTANLKLQLKAEVRAWIWQYASKILAQAKSRTGAIMDYIHAATVRLNQDIKSLEDLRDVMMVLKDVRERDAIWELEVGPILELYYLLDRYLPAAESTATHGATASATSSTTSNQVQENVDQRQVFLQAWSDLVDLGRAVTFSIHNSHGPHHRRKLLEDVKDFHVEIRSFREEFNAVVGLLQGAIDPEPVVEDKKKQRRASPDRRRTSPLLKKQEEVFTTAQALERLAKLKSDLGIKKAEYERCKMGEDLFGLPETHYSDLVITKKMIGMLDRVYGLYVEVVEATEAYQKVCVYD